MKRTIIVLIATLVVAPAAVLGGARRERSIAAGVAQSFVESVTQDAARLERAGLPPSLVGGSFHLVDTDLFDRTWFFWFEDENLGAINLRVHAPRGVSFIPLFNSKDSLRVTEVEYVPPDEER